MPWAAARLGSAAGSPGNFTRRPRSSPDPSAVACRRRPAPPQHHAANPFPGLRRALHSGDTARTTRRTPAADHLPAMTRRQDVGSAAASGSRFRVSPQEPACTPVSGDTRIPKGVQRPCLGPEALCSQRAAIGATYSERRLQARGPGAAGWRGLRLASRKLRPFVCLEKPVRNFLYKGFYIRSSLKFS